MKQKEQLIVPILQ